MMRTLFACLVVGASSLVQAEEGLFLHYAFKEGGGTSLEDSSGMGNTGEVVGEHAWKKAGGRSAISFDGTHSYIDCGAAAAETSVENGLTFLGWVRLAHAEGGWNEAPAFSQRSYLLSWGASGFSVLINNGRLLIQNPKDWRAGVTPVESDRWYQIGITASHGQVVFYINGEVAGEAELPEWNSAGAQKPLIIGKRVAATNEFFDGQIADVKLYNRRLESAEIKQKYLAEASHFPKPEIAAAEMEGRWYGDAPWNAPSDLFASSDSMLVHTDRDGCIRKIWAGFPENATYTVPLVTKVEFNAEIHRDGEWVKLSSLPYKYDGTRPGVIRMQSEDGSVALEMSAKKNLKESPVFVRYTFDRPYEVRYVARLAQPKLLKGAVFNPKTSALRCSLKWNLGPRRKAANTRGPDLVVATAPACKFSEPSKGSFVLSSPACKEFTVCLDATGSARVADVSVDAWLKETGGMENDPAEVSKRRVEIETDNPELNTMLGASVDAIRSIQFLPGAIITDAFHYLDAWQRDGAMMALTLGLAGETQAAGRYYDFWARAGTWAGGGGEREAQQPGITIMCLYFQSRIDADAKAFLSRYWPFVKKYSDYYSDRIRKEGGMLTLADEWICYMETKASWPNAEVFGGLQAAVKIARILGKSDDAANWQKAAESLKSDFQDKAYSAEFDRYVPHAGKAGEWIKDSFLAEGGGPARDERVDSAMFALARYEFFGKGLGLVSVDDPRFVSTIAQVRQNLEYPDGTIRMDGPAPDRTTKFSPDGRPWAFMPLQAWAAQVEAMQKNPGGAWSRLMGMLRRDNYNPVEANYYFPEGMTFGQVNSGNPFLAWTHGEFYVTTLLMLLGADVDVEGADLALSPSLPEKMNEARIKNFSYRGRHLEFSLHREGEAIQCTVEMRAEPGATPLAIRIPNGEVKQLAPGGNLTFTQSVQ